MESYTQGSRQWFRRMVGTEGRKILPMPGPEGGGCHDGILFRKGQQVLVAGNEVIGVGSEERCQHLLVRGITQIRIFKSVGFNNIRKEDDGVDQILDSAGSELESGEARQYAPNFVHNIPR